MKHTELFNSIWNTRISILSGHDYSCIHQFIRFFAIYANHVTPHQDKVPLCIEEIPRQIHIPIKHGPCLATSKTGADSTLLRTLYPSLPVLEIEEDDWLPVPTYHKREFQIALTAMSLGYSEIFIGISDFDEEDVVTSNDPYQFEYTMYFLNLWNHWFPTKIRYPLYRLSRVRIYHQLFTLGIDLGKLNPCNKQSSYCGDCIKCVTHYLIAKNFGVDITPPTSKSIKLARDQWDLETDFYDIKKYVRQLGLGTSKNFSMP